MKKKALMPISSVLVALLLALVVGVFSASPFGEREVAHAQTGPTLDDITVTIVRCIIDVTRSLMSPAATLALMLVTCIRTVVHYADVHTTVISTTVTAEGVGAATDPNEVGTITHCDDADTRAISSRPCQVDSGE